MLSVFQFYHISKLLAADFADWEPDFEDEAFDAEDEDLGYDEFDFDEE